MVKNETLIFNEIPSGVPKPGQTTKKVVQEFDTDASPDKGSVTAQTVVLSLDPYMRGRMRDANSKSYVPAFPQGKPLTNFGVSRVLKSSNPNFKEGDHLYGTHEFAEYQTFSEEQLKAMKVLENKEKLPWTTWVGAAGMPGLTAYYGLHEIGRPEKGQTIFVSGASGAVGQMVINLAHRAGLKVIASAGADEKVEFLRKELNVEVAFNYKTESTDKILSENKFHLYFDNVGGETLEAVLNHIEPRGVLIECGQISAYNGDGHPIPNTFMIVGKQLRMEGFIILQSPVDQEAFYKFVPSAIADGTLKKPKEHVVKGLDNGEAFVDLLTGGNFGKSVISFE